MGRILLFAISDFYFWMPLQGAPIVILNPTVSGALSYSGGASLTIVSKMLHGVVTKLRQRAAGDRAEAVALAQLLDDLFDLRVRVLDE